MYLVTCFPAIVGNQNIKSYWCGGRQWDEGTNEVPDSEMTPELLAALENDSKVVGKMMQHGKEIPIFAGARRIRVKKLGEEPKVKKSDKV